MCDYELVIDESGSFEHNNRYIVIGGLLIKSDSKEKEILLNYTNNLREILGKIEIHSMELNSNEKFIVRGAIFSKLRELKDIKAIVYIFDLDNTYIFKQYDKTPCNCSRKTFKYNKALELIYRALIRNYILKESDNLKIILDKIDLNNEEQSNIKNWLHEFIPNIEEVSLEDSVDNGFIQIADIIVNSYPKTNKYIPKRLEFKLLNPFFEVFPRNYKEDYILKTKR